MPLSLYAAKTQLSALVDRAAAGEEIIITKYGRPRARLVPLAKAAHRRPGGAKGKIWVARDFDAPLPRRVLRAFARPSE
ncbi:MAG TPA: type II toxin-antitoxin system prevent-host-death family antitoxin [Vicinamibacterales bacterium]|nr:type II toxin-antitoxin system prevent-host-death family antitoxin [Vicinamibacterales bacterium]